MKCQHWKKAPDEWTCEVCAGCSITDSNSEAGSSEAGSSSSDRSGPQQRVEDSDTDADVEVRDNSGGPQPCANYRKGQWNCHAQASHYTLWFYFALRLKFP